MDTEIQNLVRVPSALKLFSQSSESSISATLISVLHLKTSVICFSIPQSFNPSFFGHSVMYHSIIKGGGCGRAMVLSNLQYRELQDKGLLCLQ